MVALQVAESYLNQDAFYFPHNLDFRGRAYPMHPNLNHLGADLSRGLLQFADAKPLGPDGLRWLEISVSLPSLYLSTPLWCHPCCLLSGSWGAVLNGWACISTCTAICLLP